MRRFSLGDFIEPTPLDPIMKRFFYIVMAGTAFLFVKIGLDLVTDPWMNGFLVGGLVMLVACALALVMVLHWPGRRKTRSR